MTISVPGVIGAAIGFLVALVTYVVVSAALKRSTAQPVQQPVVENPATRQQDPASLVRTILLADLVVLTAVGYYVGQLLG
jgi:hypothetical protein